jgi:hypothetical protein
MFCFDSCTTNITDGPQEIKNIDHGIFFKLGKEGNKKIHFVGANSSLHIKALK